MDAAMALFDNYGPLVLVALGFAEFAGIPIASVPFLIAAGALSGMGGPGLLVVILLTAGGALVADGLWYAAARRGGRRLVGAACGLSSNPGSCVTAVETRVTRIGRPYILASKFIPGAGNLVAPAAGFGCFPAIRFLAADAAALLLWATAYAGLGRVFAPQVEALIRTFSAYATWALVAAGGALVTAGSVMRILKSRAHAHGHAIAAPAGLGTAEPTNGAGEAT